MPAQEASSVVQIGEWAVHPALDSISRGTETQKLEPRAMRLLICLANSPGEVVSIDRLLNEVWAGVVVEPASIYQAVSQLRKTLGDVDQKPAYIATVPRKGYRLVSSVQRAGAAQRAIPEKSIAVLPFDDMSERKDQEYFADGMAEEIINLLVKISALKVIGRTSSFRFKGKTEDLRSIGTQLGVAHVLQGSVRKSGDRLRVTAQLIDTRDGTHLFARTYDRDLSDVLMLQDEIAAKLVRAMQIEVSPSYIVERPVLRNMQAYTLYLQGLHACDRLDQQGLQQAASYYQRALDLDASFAAAAVGLGEAYGNLGILGFLAPAVAFEQARGAAELALKLDPKLAIAHALLATIHGGYDWDWPASERDLSQALVLAPNNAGILLVAARQSLIMGRWDDALKRLSASLEQDPLNPMCYLFLSSVQLRRGRLAEAEAAIRRALDISPTYAAGPYALGLVLLSRNQPEAALAEMRKEPIESVRLIGSALASFALGLKVDSDAALAQLLKSYAAYIPSGIGSIYAFRGESDEAFKWLDRAYERKDPLLFRIKFTPELDKLHDDLRYKAFLRKMNLPE